MTLTATKLSQRQITCTMYDASTIDVIEEWLWTLPNLISIEQVYEPISEQLTALRVVSNDRNIVQALITLMDTHQWHGIMAIIDEQIITEQDWAESWKTHWHVQRLLPQLVIQPSWEPYKPTHPNEFVIQLDPGSAFGTGTHPSTQQVLYLMLDAWRCTVAKPTSLLDVGTGSGILAILGAKLGIPTTMAIDIDPQAVIVAQENTERNGVDTLITCSDQLLNHLPKIPRYDWVTANILAPVLCEMMPELACRLVPGGLLFMAGIIIDQWPAIREATSAQGLQLQRFIQCDPWLSLCYQKPTSVQ